MLTYDPRKALQALGRDPRLAVALPPLGPFTLEIRPQSPYLALVRSILYQQLAGKAAATIHGRVQALLGEREADPAALLALPDEALRGAGVSRNKLAALRDLAVHTQQGSVPREREALLTISDEDIIRQLTQVRGVGVWTVQMMLMFNLGRPDVWPTGDLGVRRGVQMMLGRDSEPTPRELEALGEPWKPYRSVVAWYAWRAVDAARERQG